MFRKVLIANRGEIALRIIRTCKKLDVKTVAVYSEPDVELQHVLEADEAYKIGPGEPSRSYLNVSNIVEAATRSGADAVHPGYGFLAENPKLARRCEESGLVFVGPPSKVLEKVANKLESKRVVSAAGIPVVPGSEKEVFEFDEAEAQAYDLGFPILVKAAFGGGGRGMRIVRTSRELKVAFDRASAEAETGFGRPELYFEKYLDRPRHIEVQLLCGKRRNKVHLGERECSIQRRYQKLLEETPSPALTRAKRKLLVDLAFKVAEATRYESAGTVEFIMSREGRLYYMETNKRIQVEHLISEMVSGVDIVEQQLRIASGEGLNLSQDELELSGVAINCRINAEDPRQGFVPTPGRVTHFATAGGLGVRVDTALFDGCPVPEFYDSLIAKVACFGRTREDSIRRMRVALEELVIVGVQTTIPVHQMLMQNRMFVRGDYHTQLLDRLLEDWKPGDVATGAEVAAIYGAIRDYAATARVETPPMVAQSRWKSSMQSTDNRGASLFVEGA